jgi:hypothetical protein
MYADQDPDFLFLKNVNMDLGWDLGVFRSEKRKFVLACGKIEMHCKNFEFFVVAVRRSWLR